MACVVLWGSEAAKSKDNMGTGTDNRVVIYDGPPDEQNGQWIRHTTNLDNTQRREQPGRLYRWQRVTIDVWAYNGAPPAIALELGTEEAARICSKDYLVDAVERAVLRTVKTPWYRDTFYSAAIV